MRADPLEQPWLTVVGSNDLDLARTLTGRVKSHVQRGEFTWEDVKNIAARNIRLLPANAEIHPRELEHLRHLCQIWDVELRSDAITSHRPLIGPFIVAAKKGLFRLVRALFKNSMRQQRDFNATSILLLAKIIASRGCTNGRDNAPQ